VICESMRSLRLRCERSGNHGWFGVMWCAVGDRLMQLDDVRDMV
jgi:hypothetical protein